jgi:hypothetical protein
MMTLYTIACVRTIIDSSSNNLSCIEILEELSVASFPNVFPEVAVIWCIARDANEPGELPCTFHILLNDAQLYEAPVEVAFRGSHRTRAIVRLAGLVITNPGRLRFEFRSAQATGSWRFEINGPPPLTNPAPIMASGPRGQTH